MKATQLLFVALLIFTAKDITAQDFTVPTGYTLKTAADYSAYEKDIISAAKWLTATAWNEQEEKRKQVSAFVVTWISGSPTVNVELNSTILDFDKKNKGMMVLFMASSAKYVLENNYSKDMRAKHRAALRDMINVYKASNGIKKDKKMDKLAKADEAGTIDEWLEENLKVNQ